MANHQPDPPHGTSSITINPWRVIERALSLDTGKATVIVVILACLAVIAIAAVWFRSGFDNGFALQVALFGALAYIGLAILANLRGLLVHILAWFLAMTFMLLTTAAVAQVVSAGRALPGVTVWCLYNWFDQGCALAPERTQVSIGTDPVASPDQLLGPQNDDAWVSINFSEPWTPSEAENLKQELAAIDWDVPTREFNPNPSAEGTLEVRYSSPEYREDAINLADTLQKLIEDDTDQSVKVYDLSDTRWRDAEFPMHIQIWMGTK